MAEDASSCGSLGWIVKVEAEADELVDEEADDEASEGICEEPSLACPATEWAI